MTSVAYGIALAASRGVLAPAVAPVLDRLSAAPSAGFATWRLRNAYAGGCIRVRRASDNGEQDIGFSGSNLDTVALLAFAAGGDAFVKTLYDQSGNGRDLSQATAASQPKIVSAGSLIAAINGLPSLQFDGSNDRLSYGTLGNFIGAGAYTMMALARPTAGGPNNDVTAAGKPALFGDGANYMGFRFGASQLQMEHYHGGPVAASVGSLSYPQTLVAQGSYDGTTIKARADGGAAASAAGGTVDDVTNTAYLGYNSIAFFAGTCAGFLIFNSAISLADINIIGAELASKGGTTWTTAT